MLITDLVKEYLLILKNNLVPIYKNIPDDWEYGSKGNVILLNGFNENWYFLHTIAQFLNSKGFKIHAPTYNSRGKIITDVKFIQKYIESNNLTNIILIGHSKGGLIARYLLASIISERISQTIIISTPNHGTLLGYLKLFNLYELQPNSLVLKNLTEESNSRVHNIFAKLDNHVIPNSSLELRGANNIRINIIGHTRILESKALLDRVESILHIEHTQ